MWKTNNSGTFPAEIPVRASFPLIDGNYKDAGNKGSQSSGLAIATLQMYRPICKQSNLYSRGSIIFLRYLSYGNSLSLLPSFLHDIRDIRECTAAFVFTRKVIVVIGSRNIVSRTSRARLVAF